VVVKRDGSVTSELARICGGERCLLGTHHDGLRRPPPAACAKQSHGRAACPTAKKIKIKQMDPHNVHTPPPPAMPEKRHLTPEAWEALQKLQSPETLQGAAGHDYVPIALTRSWEDYADTPAKQLTVEEQKRAEELLAKVKKVKEEQALRKKAEADKQVKQLHDATGIKDLAYN